MADTDVIDLGKVSTADLVGEIKERGLFASKIPPSRERRVFKGESKSRGARYKFGLVSDTQIGSQYQQISHLHAFYKMCADEKVDAIFHAGDVVDGDKVYRGQEYELFLHGANAQRNYVVKHYPHIEGVKTYMISGNHDTSFWKVSGYNIVEAICEKRDDLVFLGDDYATYMIGKIKIALMHPRGQVPYARSYRLQKIIEQMSSDNKPNLLVAGHLHILATLPMYRNVFGIQISCFQSQTPFLATLGLNPEIGGGIFEFGVDSKGMTDMSLRIKPFYVPVKNDF